MSLSIVALTPDLLLRPAKTQKAFTKGQSFQKDLALLSTSYVLQEASDLKELLKLIVVIHDNDEEDKLADVLESCARFSIQLASAPEADRVETMQSIMVFRGTVEKIRRAQLSEDAGALDGLNSMVSNDISTIKTGLSEGLSKALDVTIGQAISILSVVKAAALSYRCPGFNLQLDWPLACCRLFRKLETIAEECNQLSQLGVFSRYFQQAAQAGDLQSEALINIKLDIETLKRNIESNSALMRSDFAALHNLPSHPFYTPNKYLENSRDDVIKDVSEWITTSKESVLWIHGAAGLGKSTVAQQLIYLLQSDDRLAGAVFLKYLTNEHPIKVIQMVAKLLGEKHPQAIPNIADAARRLNSAHDPLSKYVAAYVIDPIRALKYPYQLVIVVDGLDEWTNRETFLAELVNIPSDSPVKFVLTSRFNHSIERVLDKALIRKYPLPQASQQVIERYFCHYFESDDIDWNGRKPDQNKICQLAALADGLLVWAATVRSLVLNNFDGRNPHEILNQIIWSEQKVAAGNGRQLESLYRSAMSTLFPADIQASLRDFLGAILVLQEALPISDFAKILGIPQRIAKEIHGRLAALQIKDDSKSEIISPAAQSFHSSFLEFIQSVAVQTDGHSFHAMNTEDAHLLLGNRCLEIFFLEFLQSFPGQKCTYSDLRSVTLYCVKYWPIHLSNGTKRTQLLADSILVHVSDAALQHWSTLFLSHVSSWFRDDLDNRSDFPKARLLYELAVTVGTEDNPALRYHISCLEVAVRLQPSDGETWIALGHGYRKMYTQGKYKKNLEQEIIAWREALHLASHQDNRPVVLEELALALHARFKQQGVLSDLEEVISILREALELRPYSHPDNSLSLTNLSGALQTRFKAQGDPKDLDEAISIHREALKLWPAPHPDYHLSLNSLAAALHTRFKEQGDLNDLDEAISLHQEALHSAPHADRSLSLKSLAAALLTRFKEQGDPNDLDEVISLHQEALELPSRSARAPHIEHSTPPTSLAIALVARFGQQGAINDLDEAISIFRDALELRPAPHGNLPSTLNNLAYALLTRFQLQRTLSDLDEATSLAQEALELLPLPNSLHSTILDTLAFALYMRFEQKDRLAAALRTQYEQLGIVRNLDQAISLNQEALALCRPPQPRYAVSLQGLLKSLELQFRKDRDIELIDEIIVKYRELVRLPTAPKAIHSWALKNFPLALRARHELKGDHGDLEEAVEIEKGIA
ncbi:hypothetical protein CPB84DRAFT_1750507 [Gymnopilus junonius]|uniref:Nephrocystin 3-like N-terminal domain-containing protein n=1 Tax=Gymnopilus junonius TaxID=109634 RepID=A0A9P5TJY6_GYMJU|nr:hypothetical protein CPB84DRAFT_1750507 [Gymnopilus junonius]